MIEPAIGKLPDDTDDCESGGDDIVVAAVVDIPC